MPNELTSPSNRIHIEELEIPVVSEFPTKGMLIRSDKPKLR